jgi:hypothetical protein
MAVAVVAAIVLIRVQPRDPADEAPSGVPA